MIDLERDILRGWKEIEAALRLSRQTIRACGYPIHTERHKNRKGRSVYALRSELKKFMEQRQESDS